MTVPKHAVPTVLQIKLSAHQHHDFAACAEVCGLDLETWILQCADVQAAAVIDAMQAPQRQQRASRRKHSPRPRAGGNESENSATVKSSAAGKLPTKGSKGAPVKSSVLEAACSYNARFRQPREGGPENREPGRMPILEQPFDEEPFDEEHDETGL